MPRFHPLLLALAACSGSIDIAPGSESIVGSYDLTFQGVTPTDKGLYGPTPPASPGTHARLDIRKGGSGYDAVVTSTWGSPASMQVGLDGGKVSLTGSLLVRGSSTTDTWSQLVFQLDSSGYLSGSFSGTGGTEADQGDVVWTVAFTGNGALGPDTTPPSVKASPLSAGPPAALLPWDVLAFSASEPIDVGAWQGKTALAGSRPMPIVYAPGTTTTWVGDTSLLGYLSSWDGASGQATLSVQGGLADPSGNASAAFSTSVSFLDVGQKVAAFHFDGTDTTSPGQWGKTAVVPSGGACDSAGCMEIGPTNPSNPCTPDRHGIAGRLDTTGKTKLVVHFRVRENPGMYSGPNVPSGLPVLTVSVAARGAVSPATETTFGPGTMSEVSGPFKWQSDWQSSTVPLPAGPNNEVGFTVTPFAGYGCGGGPAPISNPVDLLIDGITLQ
jgi:hypothetical protein